MGAGQINCVACRLTDTCKYYKEVRSFNFPLAREAIFEKINKVTEDDPGENPPKDLPWLAIACRYYEGQEK